MTGTNFDAEKNCIALGGLDGRSFVKALSALRSNLSRLEAFFADLSDAVDVGAGPMASVGHEVDRDAIVIDHLDESVGDAVTRLIDLRVVTRTARAALQQAQQRA